MALMYKSGRSSAGTRHLILPGGKQPICGRADVEQTYPGLHNYEMINESDYCGSCKKSAASLQEKYG